MHYGAVLVHSLWEHLWIENLFSPKYAADMGKQCLYLVDTKVFLKKFIHSPRLGLGTDGRAEGHIEAETCAFGEGGHAAIGFDGVPDSLYARC